MGLNRVSCANAPVDPRVSPEAGHTAGDRIRRTVCLTLTIARVWARPPRQRQWDRGAFATALKSRSPRRTTEVHGAFRGQRLSSPIGATGDPGASREAQHWLSSRNSVIWIGRRSKHRRTIECTVIPPPHADTLPQRRRRQREDPERRVVLQPPALLMLTRPGPAATPAA